MSFGQGSDWDVVWSVRRVTVWCHVSVPHKSPVSLSSVVGVTA